MRPVTITPRRTDADHRSAAHDRPRHAAQRRVRSRRAGNVPRRAERRHAAAGARDDLQPHGYDYSVQGNLIPCFKRRLETRRFDLNYVVTRRTGSRTLSASNAIMPAGVPGMNTASSATAQGSSAEVTGHRRGRHFHRPRHWRADAAFAQGRFNMDRKAALLQATDFPDRLDQIQLYLDAVHNQGDAPGADSGESHRGRVGRRVHGRPQLASSAQARRRCCVTYADHHADRQRHNDGRSAHQGFQRAAERICEPGQGERDGEPDCQCAEQRAGHHARRHAGRVLQDDDADRCGDRADSSDHNGAACDHRRGRAECHAADRGRRHDQHEHLAKPDRAHGTGYVALRRLRCRFSACAKPTRWCASTSTKPLSSQG